MADISYKDDDSKISRVYEEDELVAYRTNFMRDRDRVLYSKEFRRLSGKTQVFVAGFDDHVRTRLTHTLEVTQIAKTMGKALGLNIDLIESIALAHDIGHTPFGHIGERFLNDLTNGGLDYVQVDYQDHGHLKGFKHNLQGARVVSDLEKITDQYPGINLTNETIFGIIHHTKYQLTRDCEKKIINDDGTMKMVECTRKGKSTQCCQHNYSLSFYDKYLKNRSFSFEARIVSLADEVAQRHHDIEDAIEAKLIKQTDVITILKETIGLNSQEEKFLKSIKHTEVFLHAISKVIIPPYVNNLKSQLDSLISKYQGNTQYEIFDLFVNDKMKKSLKDLSLSELIFCLNQAINYDEDLTKKDDTLQKKLKDIIVLSNMAQKMDGKAEHVLAQIVKAYQKNPQQLPIKTIEKLIENYKDSKDLKNPQWIEKLNGFKTKSEALFNTECRKLLNELVYSEDPLFQVVFVRTIADYISGMTDGYALEVYESLYGFNKKSFK
jgi:dGTPase